MVFILRAFISECGIAFIRSNGGLNLRKSKSILVATSALTTMFTGNTSRNNVPYKTLLVGTFVCAVVGTLRSRFCVPNTVLDVPDIIWNILPNNIWHIFLISDL